MNFVVSLAKLVFGLYLFLYTLLHVLVLISPYTVNFGIFMNFVTLPFRNLSHPISYGMENVHNFYLETEPGIKVGIWHYVPEPLKYNQLHASKPINEHFKRYFKTDDTRPIILYAHGNDGDRARVNRRGLCNRLNQMGYHVFSIDYRGYGDSSGWPSEKGVVNDVVTLYNFIKAVKNDSRVFLWGHSLGTGISSHAAKVLSEFNSPPAGVVLEAPFLNISQASKEYLLAPLILNNPWIIAKMDESLAAINLRLATDENILKINSKVLVLHAADDWFIPQDHSIDLVRHAKANRPKNFPPVSLMEFHSDLGLGHNEIYTHEELYPVVKKFIESK